MCIYTLTHVNLTPEVHTHMYMYTPEEENPAFDLRDMNEYQILAFFFPLNLFIYLNMYPPYPIYTYMQFYFCSFAAPADIHGRTRVPPGAVRRGA